MILTEISQTRIINQKIESSEFKSPKEIVSWMGAMQAQDFAMSKWAVGLRFVDSTIKIVEEAYNNGNIIRTHVLRPTWHLVSPDDIYWMLDLTAPKIKSSMKSRNKDLELTPSVFKKSNQLLEKNLANNNFLTRDELAKEYENADIRTNENRLSHLLMEAELDQLICSGPIMNNKLSYALLGERVPDKKRLTKEESLAELAKRYFTSHCPATLKDFVWWSGLSVTDAKCGLEMVKQNFISETIDSKEYWFTDSILKPNGSMNSIHLLPAFDEFLIAYCDRTASIELVHNKKAISNNGIFWPILLLNGQVAGIWKRTIKKDKLLIEIETFIGLNKTERAGIETAAQQFGSFVEKEINIIYKE